MASRTILLPIKTEGTRGKEDYVEHVDLEAVDPDAKVEIGAIQQNYHDVAKVTVSGSDRELSDLAKKSKEYFDEAWKRRA